MAWLRCVLIDLAKLVMLEIISLVTPIVRTSSSPCRVVYLMLSTKEYANTRARQSYPSNEFVFEVVQFQQNLLNLPQAQP